MNRISGSYPGGPKREQLKTKEERGFSKWIPRVVDLERSAGRRSLRHRNRARRTHLLAVVGLTLVVSGIGGMYMGLQAHKSSEDLARAEREKARPADIDLLLGEADRLLNELWKMEDLERTGR